MQADPAPSVALGPPLPNARHMPAFRVVDPSMRFLALLFVTFLVGVASPYAAMAPIDQYRIADPNDEISLARSAAPPSISADAEVLVLGPRGYEVAAKGTNGFVCFVERSWTAGFDDREFWNPKLRSPNCFNATAVRTELPQILKRTEWALAGDSKEQMIAKTRAAFAEHAFEAPEPGALSFMLSKRGYISDDANGPWLPHVMFFVSSAQARMWGAGLDGSPIIGGAEDNTLGSTTLFIPVRRWSDGTLAVRPTHHQTDR